MFSRWLRSGSALPGRPTPCAPAQSTRVRLALETLEDRLVPTGLTYSEWQSERFHVDDVPVANSSVQANVAPQPVNQSFGSLIGLDRAFADYAYRGQGVSVAVIDTGIDYRHQDLGGGWGRRVIAGYDFVNNDNDPLDDNGHGTHVAGIIGSSSATFSGIAPQVNLIALKVLDADGSGTFGDVEAALQWVAQHQAQYNIVAINMSLGSGNYRSTPDDYLADEFIALRNAGVFMAVAAGNSFYTYGSQAGLAYPAVSPQVVSVGAVWAKDFGQVSWLSGARDFATGPDRVASFSQRGSGLDLVAPGALITSTYLNGAYQSMAGTSMASPVVAGAAALLHQALAAKGLPATQDAILSILRSTGDAVVDGDDENDNVTNTGLTFRRLSVDAALDHVASQNGDGSPLLSAIADQNISPGGSRIVALHATDPNNDALTFSAHIVAAGSDWYELRQQLGLTHLGSYYANVWGQGEKWLGGAGGSWYCILSNGELRRWAGTMDMTLNDDNLVATLDAACYANPSLVWDAQPGHTPAVTLSLAGNQLTLVAQPGYTGSFQVEVSVSDGQHSAARTFTVTVANQAPVWTAIADQFMKRTDDKRAVTLAVTDPEGDVITYSAVAVAMTANAAAPPVALSIDGNQLTIDPAASFAGKFRVEVTANDGNSSSTMSFTVETENSAPFVGPIAGLNLRRGARATVALNIGDLDGDAVTTSVRVLPGNYDAYQLDRQLDLNYKGSYFQNFMGLNEKWVATKNPRGPQDWYLIRPNGELRRHGGTLAATLRPTNLIARLDASYYANPQLLWNAKLQAAPTVGLKLVGNKLTITPPANYVGQFFVELSSSDGYAATKRLFKVRVS